MEYYSSHINKLIEEFSRLPGIGAKSAQRLAFHILNLPKEQVEELSSAIVDAKANVCYCKECYTLTDQEICPICRNEKRNHHIIMVVENTRDLAAYEKTGKFDGVYHVLHGAISPMLGIGPDDIKLKELLQRLTEITGYIVRIAFHRDLHILCQRIVFSDSRENLVELEAVELTRGSTAQIDGFNRVVVAQCLDCWPQFHLFA